MQRDLARTEIGFPGGEIHLQVAVILAQELLRQDFLQDPSVGARVRSQAAIVQPSHVENRN